MAIVGGDRSSNPTRTDSGNDVVIASDARYATPGIERRETSPSSPYVRDVCASTPAALPTLDLACNAFQVGLHEHEAYEGCAHFSYEAFAGGRLYFAQLAYSSQVHYDALAFADASGWHLFASLERSEDRGALGVEHRRVAPDAVFTLANDRYIVYGLERVEWDGSSSHAARASCVADGISAGGPECHARVVAAYPHDISIVHEYFLACRRDGEDWWCGFFDHETR